MHVSQLVHTSPLPFLSLAHIYIIYKQTATHTHTHTHVRVCMHACTHTQTYTDVCVHACIHTQAYTDVHTHTHTHKWFTIFKVKVTERAQMMSSKFA